MSAFTDRISQYPLISDSINASANAYNWVSSGERFKSIFQLSEQAVGVLKEKAKSVASSGPITHLDDLACRQILDRIECVFPNITRPTEELFGPISDRALTAAESYMEYFLPNSKDPLTGQAVPLTRYDRLMRLQSVLRNSDAVQSAQSTISSAHEKMLTVFNFLLCAAKSKFGTSNISEDDKQEQKSGLATLASLVSQYQSAAMIAFPKFHEFIDGAIQQSQGLLNELRQSDHPSQFALEQLRTVVQGMHTTLTGLNERRESWLQGLVPETSNLAGNIELNEPTDELSEAFRQDLHRIEM